MSLPPVPIDVLTAGLRTHWAPMRINSLVAALDPKESGSVSADDFELLSRLLFAPGTPSCSAESDTLGSTAVSKAGSGESVPTFVRSIPPPKQKDSSRHYFRPMNSTDLAASAAHPEEAEVFERCAQRCLDDRDCWYFSLSPEYRSCTLARGICTFTSQSV